MRILGADLATNRRRTSVKWRAFPEDVLPLWVAEMDATLPPAVVEEVGDLLARGDTGYAWPGEYVDAFTEFAADLWHWSVDAPRIRTVTDVMVGMEEMTRILLPDGGRVLIDDPVYDAFPLHIDNIRREHVRVPLTAEGRLDLEQLEQAFSGARDEGVAAVYWLCNPQNPTGTVPTKNELTALAALAEQTGVRVISDEIHAPLVDVHTDFVPYLTVDPRGITATSPSKSFNLAGLKAGLVIAGEEASDALSALHPVVSYAASHVAVRAHTAAYRHGRDWLEQVRSEIQENRALLADLLAEHLPKARWRQPQATYLAWINLTHHRLGSQPARTLAKRAKVALSEGTTYGPAGQGHVRMNLATSPEIIREAVSRIEDLVDAWGE